MKVIILLLFVIFLISCKSKRLDPYNQSNYVLVKTDSFNGNIGTQYYVFKDDSSRKFQVYYWGDGKLMAKGFMHHGKMDGKFEMYDYLGKLMSIDSFVDGKKISEKKFFTLDTSVKLN